MIMKNYPTLYTMADLMRTIDNGAKHQTVGGNWVPHRPMGYPTLKSRIKIAWKVFTGSAYAVVWPNKQ